MKNEKIQDGCHFGGSHLGFTQISKFQPFPPTLALINVVSDKHKGGHAIASCNSIRYGYQFAK